jgi:3-isopropylmalate/(R)-2-methylmalate dehydratase small subunit
MTNEELSNLKGKIWLFGDHISTDLLMPAFSTGRGLERARYCMRANRPGWSEQVQSGDLLVAGRNFGCGSSRAAARNLILLGVRCVIAESMSRLFFRNSIALGLPVVIAPRVNTVCKEGDILRVDLPTGLIENLSSGKTLQFEPLPEDSPPMQILKAGGIIRLLEQEYLEKNV